MARAPRSRFPLTQTKSRQPTALIAEDGPTEVQDDSLTAFVQAARTTAHDFNNVLATVTGYSELSLMLNTDPRIRGYLNEIHVGVIRRERAAVVTEWKGTRLRFHARRWYPCVSEEGVGRRAGNGH